MLNPFPESVEIAVLAGRDLGRLDAEKRLGGLAGFEELTIGLAVGQKLDPLDVMFLFHGMGDGADLDQIALVGFLDDRNVFFLGGVHGVLGYEFHRLPAADQFSGTAVQYLDDIAAHFTLIDLQLLSHDINSFSAPERSTWGVAAGAIRSDARKHPRLVLHNTHL